MASLLVLTLAYGQCHAVWCGVVVLHLQLVPYQSRDFAMLLLLSLAVVVLV
jgi:hypothetical protein